MLNQHLELWLLGSRLWRSLAPVNRGKAPLGALSSTIDRTSRWKTQTAASLPQTIPGGFLASFRRERFWMRFNAVPIFYLTSRAMLTARVVSESGFSPAHSSSE